MFEPSAPHRLWAQAPAWGQWALIVVAGGLAGLGQAPVDQPALTLVGLAFGFWIIRPETSLPYFLRGWSLGFGYFLVFWPAPGNCLVFQQPKRHPPVSYTHLTLPTILRV